MHASQILRRCLTSVFCVMHAARARCLLRAVEALVAGRRLTLTELARHWPGAMWVHAPLKAVDRLLSNPHLKASMLSIQRAMAIWLLRGSAQPRVLVDWADLKGDGRWAVLSAAVPVGGRALTLYEQIFPLKRMGQPAAQRAFLKQLARVLPETARPILITDAGFRSDWMRAVQARGWDFIGRLRNNTNVRAGRTRTWRACSHLHAEARASPRDLGSGEIVKGDPLACRLVVARRPRKGRHKLTRKGTPDRGAASKKAQKAASEPWLLVTSLDAKTHTAHAVITAYATRMQIEEAFRDLKSHRYGLGFEDSLTRGKDRLSVLLMLRALASFAAWLMSLAIRKERPRTDPLSRQPNHRKRYSCWRRALEWLRRTRLPPGAYRLLTARRLALLACEEPLEDS